MTPADADAAMRRVRHRAQCRKSTPENIHLTPAGVAEARRVIAAAAPNMTPAGALALVWLLRQLDAAPTRKTRARAAMRREIAISIYRNHFAELSVRAAAEKIKEIASKLDLTEDHATDLKRNVKIMVEHNGGVIPSIGTIRNDLSKT